MNIIGMPQDVFWLMCSYLKDRDLVHLGQTCKQCYQLTSNDKLWECLLQRIYPLSLQLMSLIDLTKTSKIKYSDLKLLSRVQPLAPFAYNLKDHQGVRLQAFFSDPYSTHLIIYRPGIQQINNKDEFKLQPGITEYDCNGTEIGHLELKQLDSYYANKITAVFNRAQTLLLGFEKGTIQLYNYNTNESKSFHDCHSEIYTLNMHGSTIYSGSANGDIQVWNPQLKKSDLLQGHKGSVNCLELSSNFLLSGSADKTIRLWDIVTLQMQEEWTHHQASVSCLKYCRPYYTHLIASGDAQGIIYLQTVSPHCILKKFTPTENIMKAGIADLHFDLAKLFYVTTVGHIFMWKFNQDEKNCDNLYKNEHMHTNYNHHLRYENDTLTILSGETIYCFTPQVKKPILFKILTAFKKIFN